MRAAKDETVIHHQGHESHFSAAGAADPVLQLGPEEDALARIRIRNPFVENQRAEEIPEVGDLAKQGIGQVIVNSESIRIHGYAGSEMPAGVNRLNAVSNTDHRFRVGGEELRADFYQVRFWRWEPELFEQDPRHPLIDENAAVLGILFEFHYVMAAICSDDEVRLRSSAHFTYPFDGLQRHGNQGRPAAGRQADGLPGAQDTLVTMADETAKNNSDRNLTTNEVALEMMKFIALTTGYGKPGASTAGFSGKSAKSGSDEHAEALLKLFERCREVVRG